MNATVGRKELHRAARAACRGIKRDQVLPIASHILLSATPGRLLLQATDFSICMEVPLLAQVEATSAIAVPGCQFRDLAAALAGSDVLLEACERNTLRVVCGTSEYVLPCMSADEFPTLPVLERPRRLDVPQVVMRRMLREVMSACCTDSSRPILCGAYFDATGDMLKLAGTDMYRLAVSTAPMEHMEQCIMEPAIIPAQVLRELARVLGDTGVVGVEIGEHNIRLSVPGLSLISRLIEGEYPHFERAIPEEPTQQLVFERQAALDALRRLRSILPRGLEAAGAGGVARLRVEEGTLHLTVGSADVGSGCERIGCSCNDAGFSMAFGVRYLTEGLRAVSTQQVRLEAVGPATAAVLRPVDAPSGQGYLYCLMPWGLK